MMEETDIKNEIVGLSNSLSLLGSLPDSCLVCSKPYDNTDENMAFSWNAGRRKSESLLPRVLGRRNEIIDVTI